MASTDISGHVIYMRHFESSNKIRKGLLVN